MENFVGVQVMETCEDTGCKEAGLWLSEFMFFADVVAKVTSRHEIHDKVQMLSVLEGLLHIDNKWMFNDFEELTLIDDGLHTFFCKNAMLWGMYTAFDIYFIANNCDVFLCSTFHTLPNPPLPITYKILY
jgi:hypothetical protein